LRDESLDRMRLGFLARARGAHVGDVYGSYTFQR
jgi:hypothetical protein